MAPHYFQIRKSTVGGTIINYTHLELLLKGNPKEIDPEKPIEEQTHHLPYDKHWEVPRNRIKLGNLYIPSHNCLSQFF